MTRRNRQREETKAMKWISPNLNPHTLQKECYTISQLISNLTQIGTGRAGLGWVEADQTVALPVRMGTHSISGTSRGPRNNPPPREFSCADDDPRSHIGICVSTALQATKSWILFRNQWEEYVHGHSTGKLSARRGTSVVAAAVYLLWSRMDRMWQFALHAPACAIFYPVTVSVVVSVHRNIEKECDFVRFLKFRVFPG